MYAAVLSDEVAMQLGANHNMALEGFCALAVRRSEWHGRQVVLECGVWR
jgi:uncharacterized protein VirK/YbjX